MPRVSKEATILLVDDDPEDRMLTRQALSEGEVENPLFEVENGEELLDYLAGRGRFETEGPAPQPGLILLDLNMPKKDGRQTLVELKQDPALRRIPVVVLSTSTADADVAHTYDLGSNSFITKPALFDDFVHSMRCLGRYWFGVVRRPDELTGKKDG
ncbi:MAG TPA: response regulator [Thermoanaerobaculia bacterium]|nr:response regulator [Thermoanaerobaculia bacterium]